MTIKTKIFALSASVSLLAFAANAAEVTTNAAKMQAMDKITGNVSVIEVPVNAEVAFGSLSIVVRACKTRPPEETPENFAFVDIVDNGLNDTKANVFKGWMMSSTPALNALEHPVYDIWLLQCFDKDLEGVTLLSPEELSARDEIAPISKVATEEDIKEAPAEEAEAPQAEPVAEETAPETEVVAEPAVEQPQAQPEADVAEPTTAEEGAPQPLLNINVNEPVVAPEPLNEPVAEAPALEEEAAAPVVENAPEVEENKIEVVEVNQPVAEAPQAEVEANAAEPEPVAEAPQPEVTAEQPQEIEAVEEDVFDINEEALIAPQEQ